MAKADATPPKPTKRRHRSTGRKPGRPAFVPTDEERNTVENLAALGVPQEDMVRVIRRPKGRAKILAAISVDTLKAHFAEELNLGALKANAKVGRSIYDRAIDPKHPQGLTAAIWWTKNRMGWTDRVAQEHTGKNGGPIEQHLVLSPEALATATDEELKTLERVLARSVANAA